MPVSIQSTFSKLSSSPVLWLVMGLAISAAGCAPEQQTPTKGAGAKAAPAANPGAPITEEEAREFASTLAGVVRGASGAEVFDADALCDRVTQGVEAPADFVAGFRQGFGGFAPKFLGSISAEVQNGGSYDFLRTHEKEGQRWVTMRLLLPAGGVNYHDVLLARLPQGVRGVDAYVTVSGELLSETMQRIYVQSAASQNRGLLSKLTGKQSAFAAHMDDMVAMQRNVKANPQAVLDTYSTLPEELKTEKLFLLMRMMAAQQVSEAEYRKVLEDLRRLYPNDSSTAMHAIDFHMLSSEFAECRAAIDLLDKTVGGDPYLNVMRANLVAKQGDYSAARDLARKTMDDLSTVQVVYWNAVGLTLDNKDHPTTLEWIKLLDQKFHPQWQDLAKIPEYGEFAKSPQYEQWLAYRKENTSPMP